MTFEELLQAKGATCSLCEQAFNSQNPPVVTEVPDKTFHNKPVQKALCRNPPYVQKHANSPKDTTLKIVYQATARGFIAILAKDLDK